MIFWWGLFITLLTLFIATPFALTVRGVSTSISIWSSKSDPLYRDNSSSSGGWRRSPVSLTCVSLFWHLDDRRFLLAFLISVSTWLLSLFLSFSSLALALEVCLTGLTLIVAPPTDLLFGFSLIVATPELLLALYAERFSLKLISCFPISVLILLIFLDWFSVRTSEKLPIMFSWFAVFLKNVGETRSY